MVNPPMLRRLLPLYSRRANAGAEPGVPLRHGIHCAGVFWLAPFFHHLRRLLGRLRLFALGGGAVTLDASVEAAKGIYPDLALQNSAKPSERIFNPAELVVANILGPLLVAFAEEIASYARRDLVLSGMLNETWPEVCGAFAALGFAEVSRKSYGEWTTALMRRGDC